MDSNKIIKPDSQPVSESEKQEMNTIVQRIVQLIKDKHL